MDFETIKIGGIDDLPADRVGIYDIVAIGFVVGTVTSYRHQPRDGIGRLIMRDDAGVKHHRTVTLDTEIIRLGRKT